jgi:hypothetical protein
MKSVNVDILIVIIRSLLVENISRGCFYGRKSVFGFTFETGSQLRRIEDIQMRNFRPAEFIELSYLRKKMRIRPVRYSKWVQELQEEKEKPAVQ